MPPVDPNEVMMTGENSFIRLSPDGGKTLSDRASHWRVLWCPAGGGHVLFLQSTLTDAKVKIYSDNIGVARWLQKSIESLLFPAFADTSLPVVSATFERDGGPWSTATESVVTADSEITLSWYDCIEPFVLNAPPGFNDRPSGCSARSSRRAPPSSRSTGAWRRAASGPRCAVIGRARAPRSRGRRRGSSPGNNRALMKYWEDFAVGEVIELGSCSITEAEVLAFARKYDPQPFHTDPEAARRSIFGGLIASGWHTCALLMRLSVEASRRERGGHRVARPRLLPLAQAGAAGRHAHRAHRGARGLALAEQADRLHPAPQRADQPAGGRGRVGVGVTMYRRRPAAA